MEKKKKSGAGRPKSTLKGNSNVPGAKKGTKPGNKRKTYIVNIDLSEKIEEIAHQERTTVKNVVHDAFSSRVDKWEKKNRPPKVPKKKIKNTDFEIPGRLTREFYL